MAKFNASVSVDGNEVLTLKLGKVFPELNTDHGLKYNLFMNFYEIIAGKKFGIRDFGHFCRKCFTNSERIAQACLTASILMDANKPLAIDPRRSGEMGNELRKIQSKTEKAVFGWASLKSLKYAGPSLFCFTSDSTKNQDKNRENGMRGPAFRQFTLNKIS